MVARLEIGRGDGGGGGDKMERMKIEWRPIN